MRALVFALAVATLALSKVQPPLMMTVEAEAFVSSLTKEQKSKAVMSLHSADRTTWTYVPGQRKGVSWHDLNSVQKTAAQNLLKASLSKQGYDKIEAIRGLEPILAEMEHGNKERDPERYWFMFFGEPNRETPWAWRYEGHHVSLTFASDGNVLVSSTPQFLGSNPAEVRIANHKGLRVLGREQDLGFALAESLTPDQQKEAVVSGVAPNDIITGSSRQAGIDGHFGVHYHDLNSLQQKLIRELLETFASVQKPAEQRRRLNAIKHDGYDSLVFAWMGPISRKGRHYYRIQGDSFVIEYDNTQEDGNHIHTVWRDFKGDFGEDKLAEHYASDHHH